MDVTLSNVTVEFGGVTALSGLNLSIASGAIHGLIGPNGAGKTTALNVLCGLVRRNSGTYMLNGKDAPQTAVDLAKAGVGRTFQTPAIFQNMTLIENIMIGGYLDGKVGVIETVLRLGSFARKELQLRDRARQCAKRVKIELDENSDIQGLSLGHLRKIELARALMREPQLLLLDEVTSGLTEAEVWEVANLLKEISRSSERCQSIVVVEHNVPFVFDTCDAVSAMDQGRMVITGNPRAVRSDPTVIRSYLGEPVTPSGNAELRARPAKPCSVSNLPLNTVLEVKSISVDIRATPVLREVSLDVREGEVVALLGRNGAGKTVLTNAIMQIFPPHEGSILFRGKKLARMSTSEVVRRGIGLVPQLGGIAAHQTVSDNLKVAAFGLRDGSVARQQIDDLLDMFPRLRERLSIVAGGLSGGERKMLAIACVMLRQPQLVIFDEPSLGLSPVMVRQIQSAVIKIKARGVSVVVAEQNTAWLRPIADRAYLLNVGRITAEGVASSLFESESLSNAYLGAESAVTKAAAGVR